MQFSKFFLGGGVNNLKNPKNNQNKKISKALAFSLIELSIVLIIIGLLVAGVTGGASLIESAKIRKFINDINDLKQSIYVFRVSKDRLPGDLDDSGKIGYGSGHNYTAGDFPYPYDGTESEYGVPGVTTGIYVELFLEGLLKFEPKNTSQEIAGISCPSLMGGVRINVDYIDATNDSNYNREKFYYHALPVGSYFITHIANESNHIFHNPIIRKKIDQKIDDGNYNAGKMRSNCPGKNGWSYSSYDDAIEAKQTCGHTIFSIQ